MFRDNFMHPVAVHLPTCMLYGELLMQLKYADMAISAHALTVLASYANRIMELFNAICAFLVWEIYMMHMEDKKAARQVNADDSRE